MVRLSFVSPVPDDALLNGLVPLTRLECPGAAGQAQLLGSGAWNSTWAIRRQLWHDQTGNSIRVCAMRLFAPRGLILAAVVMAVVLAPAGAGAGGALPGRIQDGSADVCWATDVEFPVPCDEE
jgi:hypothetical protein